MTDELKKKVAKKICRFKNLCRDTFRAVLGHVSDVLALEKGLTPQNVFLEHAGHPVADQRGRKVQTREHGCYGEGSIGLSLAPSDVV